MAVVRLDVFLFKLFMQSIVVGAIFASRAEDKDRAFLEGMKTTFLLAPISYAMFQVRDR